MDVSGVFIKRPVMTILVMAAFLCVVPPTSGDKTGRRRQTATVFCNLGRPPTAFTYLFHPTLNSLIKLFACQSPIRHSWPKRRKRISVPEKPRYRKLEKVLQKTEVDL